MSQEELPKIDNEAISNTDGSVDQSPSAPNTESEKTSTVEEQVENTDPIAAEATPAETTVEEDTKDVAKNIVSANEEEEETEIDEDDADESSEMEIDHSIDLEQLNKDQLLSLAIESTQKLTTRDAFNRLKQIRPLFNDILRSEKKQALQAHIESGDEADNLKHDDASYRDRFKEVFNLAKNARHEERQRIEEEKIKNFKKKEALLEQLRGITESDETEKSLDDVKALQQEWRGIRVLPADKVQALWDSYHFLLDKFYDNHSDQHRA